MKMAGIAMNRIKMRVSIAFICALIMISYLSYTKNTDKNDGFITRKLLSENNEDNQKDDPIKQSKNEPKNCTSPAINNFPYIPPSFRKSFLMSIIYCFVIVYMFIGIAIVCEKYFIPSLEVICNKMHLEPDIAGSTFMAGGSSAPELAASVIGVFIAKDDIGVGAVVGSAVFNIAFVISLCALFAGSVVTLHWWPILRDSFFYLISILVLFFAMYDEKVTLIESIIFLVIYALYIVFMVYNKQIETKVTNTFQPYFNTQVDESSSLVSYKQVSDFEKHQIDNLSANEIDLKVDQNSRIDSQINNSSDHTLHLGPRRTEEIDASQFINPKYLVWSYFVYPIKYCCLKTIPDCSVGEKQKWFLYTFIISCFWISVFSYLLVWMLTIIGYNLSIPDTVMGLVFIAAGVSIPDAITSVIVVKEGQGDMALTNAIASNVVDILLCLGLPWFLKTAIIDPGSTVRVISRGLEYSTFSLISTVIFFLALTHFNGWKLTKKYGIILMIWYFVFMTMASLYELNVFGPFNPVMCVAD